MTGTVKSVRKESLAQNSVSISVDLTESVVYQPKNVYLLRFSALASAAGRDHGATPPGLTYVLNVLWL